MKIREQDVSKIADLASLDLTVDERAHMVHDLNSILDYIDRLNQLDTSSVEPTTQVSLMGAARPNASASVLRDDLIEGLRKSLPHDIAMENAPETDGVFFKVPKVIDR